MAINQKYPYSDIHELNLDWILRKMKKLEIKFDEFKIVNNITFSGAWDITKNYPAWTIVNDNNIGYVSIRPVPPGVVLTNTDFWAEVIDYSAQIAGLQNRVVTLEGQMLTAQGDITNINGVLSANDLDSHTHYAVWIGDSYTEATSLGADQDKRFSTLISAKLGLTEKNYAVGGSGFNTGTDYQTQVGNALTDLANDNIDVNDVKYVFVSGFRNDGAVLPGAQIPYLAKVTATFNDIAAGFPKAQIILCPALWSAEFMPTDYLSTIAYIKQAVQLSGVKVQIIEHAERWLSGYYQYILYQGGANVHPDVDGHRIIAENYYSAIMGKNVDSTCYNEVSFTGQSADVNSVKCTIDKHDGLIHLHLQFKTTNAGLFGNILYFNVSSIYIREWFIGNQDLFVDAICRDHDGGNGKIKISCTVTKTGDTTGSFSLNFRSYGGAYKVNTDYHMDIIIPEGILLNTYDIS